MNDDQIVTGIAWYRREQWARLRELSVDADELEESYDDWLTGVQKTLVQMAVTGVQARKVDVDVDELARWCRRERRPLDSAARAAFAAVRLRSDAERTRS